MHVGCAEPFWLCKRQFGRCSRVLLDSWMKSICEALLLTDGSKFLKKLVSVDWLWLLE